RPSVNFGKSTAMSGSAARSSAIAAGSSEGASQTPTSRRARRAVRSACHSASGTITATPAGISSNVLASRSNVQRSATIARFLMSGGIHALLERLEAEAPHRVDKALVRVPALDIDIDQACDHVRHFGRRERGADHLAERRVVALRATNRHLVPLAAVLVDTEDADVADVMMPAGVHAAGDVELEVAEIVHVIEVIETALDRLGNRDRLRVGERTEIPAGAADDVGEKADVRG